MRYKIEEIEGIGQVYGAKLIQAGVVTTEDLLGQCGSAKGRRAVAQTTGLDESQLLKWANLADLMRISGIGKQFAELLEAAGVDTVKELRHRRADHLTTKMREVKDVKRLTRGTPSEGRVADWIDQAQALEPRISY